MKAPTPLVARFWAKVAMPPHDHTDCWNWTGALRNGYGVIGRHGRKDGIEYAHRLSYFWHHEFLPDGHEVCHACNNRRCVNPLHLYPGTRRDNMQQAKAQGRLVRPYRPWSEERRARFLRRQEPAA